MTDFKFRKWLVLEDSQRPNPRILVPYIQHLTRKRLSENRFAKGSIKNEALREDYKLAMSDIENIYKRGGDLQVMYRKALRAYERHRDFIEQRARIDEDYGVNLTDTGADNDIWVFVGALEDMMQGKMPDLEAFV